MIEVVMKATPTASQITCMLIQRTKERGGGSRDQKREDNPKLADLKFSLENLASS